ncbi:hypothetical protein ARMSODRAFT_1019848 [Armillaria solidipes]|uniref:Uncharacterized protein n=1 Tax=Armillaria solidipes TaxID=1076256 RepID=A0A2H3BBN1_9AGAR|nr:hypothetical protein ARMSODRAFT_1019848 [Armillaria solidipes]
MYRTPPNGFRPSVAPDVFWQPHQQFPLPHPVHPLQTPAPPGSRVLFPPFGPHGRPGPFINNSFDTSSHFTPSGSFPSRPTFPIDTQQQQHQSQSQTAPPSSQRPPQSGRGRFSSHMHNNRHQSHNNSQNNSNNNYNAPFTNTVPLQFQHVNDLSTFSSNTSSSIPLTTSIMQLTGRATWTAWLRGIQSVADILGLLPHINEDSPDFITSDPLRRASYPPHVDELSSPQDWETHLAWRK